MLRWVLLPVAGLMLSVTAAAQAAAPSAYDVVENTTDRVMTVVENATSYADKDPERYFAELQAVLDDVVDFGYFSRAVIGPYASRERYNSLDSAGKAALRDQVQRFTGVMREGLVRTYGKGLLAFGGSRVEVQRPENGAELGDKAEIRQLIYSDAPEPYVIEYQMRRDRDGSWKLRNLIVETINLGVIYRNQFQAAARDANGDIDRVIDTWTVPDGGA
ncbi:MAG: ABC transporter substrate-binding protein [Halieaceae bacterium]|jgi:phospholipid transport system substrate-binding protein|nr:ABC transporter substrate-binding protein [Halieaceae bacterium]